jgi:putative ABC transport system substrate-binding protein
MLLAWPGLVVAQPGKRFRIGWLFGDRQGRSAELVKVFNSAMRERGFAPGERFVLEMKFADGDPRRFPALARELIASNADVVLCVETGAKAMVQATSTVPIVLFTSIDPVGAGLVKSLAQPGTNVTGMVDQYAELIAKHVELLVEIAPKSSRLVLLNDRFWSGRESYERFAQHAAAAKRVELATALVGDKEDLEQVFADLERRRPDGLIVAATGGAISNWRTEIIDGVRRLRLPTVYAFGAYALSGGLLSYGPNILENVREATEFVVRILHGASPAQMPLRQTKKFDLVVNLAEARRIGVTIPQSILLRADRVIE